MNVPPITIPNFRPKCSKYIPVFRSKRLKTIPFGAAHTYIPNVGEYPLGFYGTEPKQYDRRLCLALNWYILGVTKKLSHTHKTGPWVPLRGSFQNSDKHPPLPFNRGVTPGLHIDLTIGLMGLNPFRGSTGAQGWKNVSPICASLLFLIPQTTKPTWPANLMNRNDYKLVVAWIEELETTHFNSNCLVVKQRKENTSRVN